MAVNMLRTYDRFVAPPCDTATSKAGDGVIAAKDRPSNLTGASDQDVVASAVRGHEAAFRELVRRYERPVFSLLYRMVRDRALAEDLAQETFIKVLNGIKSYRPEFKFSSWIFQDREQRGDRSSAPQEHRHAVARRGAERGNSRADARHVAAAGRPRRIAPGRSGEPGTRNGDRAGDRPAAPRVPVMHFATPCGRVFV